MAVEVLGVSTRVGHRTCTRTSLHVRHTGHGVGDRLTI